MVLVTLVRRVSPLFPLGISPVEGGARTRSPGRIPHGGPDRRIGV